MYPTTGATVIDGAEMSNLENADRICANSGLRLSLQRILLDRLDALDTQGQTLRGMAREMGVSRRTVRAWLAVLRGRRGADAGAGPRREGMQW